MHGTPSGWHFVPQMPPLQVFVQHWLGTMQGNPSGSHMPRPHRPLVHCPEQH